MKKTPNKYINIESYNTINNSSSKKTFITVNRLTSKKGNNTSIINKKGINSISFKYNDAKPFIYKKKSKLEKSHSFCIKNRKNISLRNDKSLIKEETPLLLIPSYTHYDLKRNNINNKTYSNKKNSKNKNNMKNKCKLYLSRNNQNLTNKKTNKRYTYNNSIHNNKNKTKGISNNSTGITIGENTNKKSKNNFSKYNCYSYDDEMTINNESNYNYNCNIYDVNEDNSFWYICDKSSKGENKNNKYIKIIEKENELLKNELIKTNKKLSLLEKKIENLVERKINKINKSNIETILTNSRQRIPTYKKNNIIKKCPVPTPYVQRFSKNDFFLIKKKDIKVTLKFNNRLKNEERKNDY